MISNLHITPLARPLDVILAAAREEARINPTITVYTMVCGAEIRRPYNAFAPMIGAFRQFTDSLKKVGEQMGKFRGAVQQAMFDGLKLPYEGELDDITVGLREMGL